MSVTQAPVENFDQLWSWLVWTATSARADSPIAIHSQSGDRAGWGKPKSHVASRGLPFSRSFLRRVDHELPVGLSDALRTLKPAGDTPSTLRAVRRAQWRIVASVLRDGLVDIEECRGKVQLAPFAFQVAAVGGILALRSALGRE